MKHGRRPGNHKGLEGIEKFCRIELKDLGVKFEEKVKQEALGCSEKNYMRVKGCAVEDCNKTE